MTDSRPIDDQHEAILKTILKLDEQNEIPEAIQDEYWRFKVPADRCSYRLSVGDMIRIVLSVTGRTPEARPYSFLDVIARNPIPHGTPLKVKWRNKWVDGSFVGADNEAVVVILDDETAEQRRVNPASVKLPE